MKGFNSKTRVCIRCGVHFDKITAFADPVFCMNCSKVIEDDQCEARKKELEQNIAFHYWQSLPESVKDAARSEYLTSRVVTEHHNAMNRYRG